LPWAKRGHEIAWDEFKLPDRAAAGMPNSESRIANTSADLKWLVSSNGAKVAGKDFEIVFDQENGVMKSWVYRGTELIASPLRPDFWRAPTDNDRGRHKPQDPQAAWRRAHESPVNRGFVGEKKDDHFEVRVENLLPHAGDATWRTIYQIYNSGDVIVSAEFQPGHTEMPRLPRIGMQMALPNGFERITWFGPGPQETYQDRKDARMGVHSGTVDEQFFPDYVEPGETGNKVDVRWVALRNGKGAGLLAIGLPLLSVNALHYTTDDLQSAKHPYEMVRRDFVTLNLDLMQEGVGGDNSWGTWPHDEFLIPCKPYSYRFRLRPFSGREDPGTLARQEVR
jgi:beta-galactosidase